MKIPETGNVGAYYGNEDGRQWQANGMIIDNGVGGGVVGSGDAGAHRPPVYQMPHHMPRGPVPGYVMGGAYYQAYPQAGPPPVPDDFADYMWMENEEEFDKQVMQQLEEEALMEQCIEAMLEDEQRERHERPVANGHKHATTSNGINSQAIQDAASRSTLNPLAAEFVPNRARLPPEEKADPPEATSREESKPAQKELAADVEAVSEDGRKADRKAEEPESLQSQPEPPEVSAAHIQPIEHDKKKDKPKTKVEVKKPLKSELKPKAKSEAKVRKDSKVKSEIESEVIEVTREVVSNNNVPATDVVKQPTPPLTEEAPSTGPKPINYAAAAKAMKPKKPATPPVTTTDKPAPPPLRADKSKERIDKNKPVTASKVKTEKPIQRKNSAK
ncbi:unnamed protein product [Leptidea sinapis]|uniref:Uncharacterized protein n=1 Tax=Leptidea sinapis TaxID=189913 RepID=A0A5E4QVH5_9NEOP|nr:unnamed protein product [Leptidea sinapis]